MTTRSCIRRRELVFLALVLAVLGFGAAGTPTAAAERESVVAAANAEIDFCYQHGGEPTVDVVNNVISVRCDYPNDDSSHCGASADPYGGWSDWNCLHSAGSPGRGGNVQSGWPVLQPLTNTAPDGQHDRYQLAEDKVLRRGAATGLLRNDIDPDGHLLSVRLVDGPTKGKLKLRADGSFVYTPKRSATGNDTFRYEVSDGQGGVDLANVELTIAARPK